MAGKRSLVHGVGVNDANYLTHPRIEGKQVVCPIYVRWGSMLNRAYSASFQANQPTYKKCSVTSSWLSFMTFRAWVLEQESLGLALDKDLKIKGNTVYAPDTCLFIPASLNSLLCDSAASRGCLPKGVNINKRARSKPYEAAFSYQGRRKYIGAYATKEEAYEAYTTAKNEEIKRQAELYPQWRKYILQHQLN